MQPETTLTAEDFGLQQVDNKIKDKGLVVVPDENISLSKLESWNDIRNLEIKVEWVMDRLI
ncbi:MAG: hypothetical protein HOB18_08095, partial [Nitrospina sp.]|nr:hypothetical protein [Nitrospina sp.]